jgi:hypothetical protein
MSAAAKSLFAFAIYLFILGIAFMIVPRDGDRALLRPRSGDRADSRAALASDSGDIRARGHGIWGVDVVRAARGHSISATTLKNQPKTIQFLASSRKLSLHTLKIVATSLKISVSTLPNPRPR